MATKKPAITERTRSRGGLIRETAYLYEDETEKLEQLAEKLRCSKSEVIRRALRQMFETEGL